MYQRGVILFFDFFLDILSGCPQSLRHLCRQKQQDSFDHSFLPCLSRAMAHVPTPDEVALARRNVGLARQLEEPRGAGDPHPSRGGTRGYPLWMRGQEIVKAANNQQTFASRSSIWRWQIRIEPFRMTGNSDRNTLTGFDQLLLCYFKWLYPEASADECSAYIYNNGGSITSRDNIATRLKEMKYTRKRGSTEAHQAFLPRNLLRQYQFWNLPPPLGIHGVPRHELFDVDEAGFGLEDVNRHYGHASKGIRVRKPGNYSRQTKVTVILAVEPGLPWLAPNVLGSTGRPRRWYRINVIENTTAFEFADFMTEVIDDMETNHLHLRRNRKAIFDNLSSHLAPVVIQAIDGHPSGRYEHIPRVPYRPHEAPIEYMFCQLADALNRRLYQISTSQDLYHHLNLIIPNLTGIDNTFVHCGYL
jgi:hypothetical protein